MSDKGIVSATAIAALANAHEEWLRNTEKKIRERVYKFSDEHRGMFTTEALVVFGMECAMEQVSDIVAVINTTMPKPESQ